MAWVMLIYFLDPRAQKVYKIYDVEDVEDVPF